MQYLITATLLNSFSYYSNYEGEKEEGARTDFLRTLSREKFPPTEAMQRGIDFEDAVNYYSGLSYSLDSIEDEGYNKIACELAKIVKGGLWQQSCKKILKIGNSEFLLYGKMDVVKRDTIYDIKFTSNYEVGKFLDSTQHLIYLYCTNLPKFAYLISDGKDWWREDYHNSPDIEDKIKSAITEFLGYLENDKEAKELFYKNWESLKHTK